MNKSELYWLKNKNDIEKDVIVDRIENGKFRVLEYGKFYPILCGGYLVDNSITEILLKYVPEQIESSNKVMIWRKATDETWNNYSELHIKNHLDLEDFEDAKFDGLKIYLLMHNQIFISSELKEKFISECKKIQEIEFSNEYPLYV